MFHLNSPLAAMFELSVCAGLITAIFISAISLIKPLSAEEIARNKKSRLKRYAFLLIIIAVVAIAMQYVKTPSIGALFAPIEFDVRRMIWHVRQLDLIGQLVILLVGIFAIRILYMHKDKASHGE
jgi:NADH-quinone oxidoreductase subunit J